MIKKKLKKWVHSSSGSGYSYRQNLKKCGYLTAQFSYMKKKMLDFCEKKKTIMPQTDQDKSRVFWEGGYIDLTAYDIVIGDEEFQKPTMVNKGQSILKKCGERESAQP